MPPRFHHATLSNGLTAIAEVDEAAHTAAAGFFVRTGARDEEQRLMGVSHFLEHMMFKGSAKRSAEEVNRDFDDLGADHNAFTTSELTAFHAHTLPERLSEAVEILADILRPALRQADFDEEKGVILEEIAMYDDHPFWVLYEHAMEAHYGAHPLGHRVLGTTESIAALQRDEMERYFRDRYSADNTVVALAGRLDFDSIVAQLESLCGQWQRTAPTRLRPEPPCERRVIHVPFAKAGRHYEIMAVPAPSAQDDRRHAAAVLAEILGGSDSSRLYWALEETGIAEEAQAQYDARDGDGSFLLSFACPPERAAEAREIVLRELGALADSLVDDDLVRARSRFATGTTFAGERPAGRMARLGQVWTALGRYESLESDLARIEAIRVEDLRGIVKTFPLAPRTIASLSAAPAHDGAVTIARRAAS
ncbi:MAG TPA: pitrilysin family protein [Phycisphaerales bacterium]|nr:pitrilysin family protein [Phycisphaerales bacterium]HMP36060.1 pitrilysin family protein [Phycisphaerales bacterium]